MSQFDPTPSRDAAGLQPGSIDQTLAGNADLRVGAVLREAWERIDGIKAPLLAGGFVVYAAISIVLYGLGTLFGVGVEDEGVLANSVVEFAVMLMFYPFLGGVFMFGLRRSVGQPVRFEDLFAQYGRTLPIVAVALLQGLLSGIGLMLLIFPGIYLSIALSLAVPLKVERDLPVVECLATSFRLVNRKLLEVATLSAISAGLMALGVLSVIGWIWTIPWAVLIFAITYRQMAGLRDSAPAAPTALGTFFP